MPVSRRSTLFTPMLSTTRERDGYDGMRGGAKWWFEAWGSDAKATWTMRDRIGRPPTPTELRNADYIVIGVDTGGHVTYRTMTIPLDL